MPDCQRGQTHAFKGMLEQGEDSVFKDRCYVYSPLFRKERKLKALLNPNVYCSVGIKNRIHEKAVEQGLCNFHFLGQGGGGSSFALDPVALVGDTRRPSGFSGYVWGHGHIYAYERLGVVVLKVWSTNCCLSKMR